MINTILMKIFSLQNSIVAHKLGAKKVVLTDGDTDTLANMRDNVSSNVGNNYDDLNNSIICKQLRWGKRVEEFRHQWSHGEGFDIVMVCCVLFVSIFSPNYVSS